MDGTWEEDRRPIKDGAWYGSFADRVLVWLEGDDTELEKVLGYGICLAATTYAMARLFI